MLQVWELPRWRGKQFDQVAVGVVDVDLPESVRPGPGARRDGDTGGLKLVDRDRAVVEFKGHVMTTGGHRSGEAGGSGGPRLVALEDDMDLGFASLEPEPGEGKVRTGDGSHSQDLLVEVPTGLQVPGDHRDVIYGTNRKERSI